MKITQVAAGWYSGSCLVFVHVQVEEVKYHAYVLVDRETGKPAIPTYFRKQDGTDGEVQNNVMPADVVKQVEDAARKFLLKR